MEHPMDPQAITLKSVPMSQFNDNFIVHQISKQRHKTSSLTNKLNYQHGIEYLKKSIITIEWSIININSLTPKHGYRIKCNIWIGMVTNVVSFRNSIDYLVSPRNGDRVPRICSKVFYSTKISKRWFYYREMATDSCQVK